MTASPDDFRRKRMETFLSRTYLRIRVIAVVLSAIAATGGALFWNWRVGLGVALGAALGYINLIWLHCGAAMMIERMLAAAASPSSGLRVYGSFAGRYLFVLVLAYVILKGFHSMVLAFIVGLFLPILAATCEGLYEIIANRIT